MFCKHPQKWHQTPQTKMHFNSNLLYLTTAFMTKTNNAVKNANENAVKMQQTSVCSALELEGFCFRQKHYTLSLLNTSFPLWQIICNL